MEGFNKNVITKNCTGVAHGPRKRKGKCGPDMSIELLLLNWRHLDIFCAREGLLYTRVRTFHFSWRMKRNRTQGNGNMGK